MAKSSSILATMRCCSLYGGNGINKCLSLSAFIPWAVVPELLSINCFRNCGVSINHINSDENAVLFSYSLKVIIL